MENYISIDIGTKNTKIIWVSKSENDMTLKVVSKKSYPTSGMSFGYINNSSLFLTSFKKAISSFEKENRIKIDEAFFSLNGFGIHGENKSVTYQTADDNISEYDMESAGEKAITELRKKNKDEIIETIYVKSVIDGFEHYSSPVDLQAKKFEAEYLFITQPKNSIIIFEEMLSTLDIDPLGFSPALLASGEFSISELDKKLGCALVDLGDEITTIAIYDNTKLVYYNVLKYGVKEITRKIGVLESVDFQKAEEMKESKIIGKKHANIIQDELNVIVDKIKAEIKLAGREDILPGGVTLVGGGARTHGIKTIFREKLNLPIKNSVLCLHDNRTDYHCAYGALLAGRRGEQQKSFKIKSILDPVKRLLKKFTL